MINKPNQTFVDWLTGDLITATKLNQMKNANVILSANAALPGSASFGNISPNSMLGIGFISVPGAAVGDAVLISVDAAVGLGSFFVVGWVVSANLVAIDLVNPYNSAVPFNPATYFISVFKP